MRIEDIDEQEVVVPKKEAPKENVFFIEDLPSKYKLYPEGTKLYGRPLNVREVKKLSALNEHNFDIIIKEVLSTAITGYPISDILSGDKLYLIFWLRANTYKDARFVTPFICDECGKQSEYKFDVGAFDINYLENFDGSLELRLLNKKATIGFSFNTIKDEDRIKRFVDSNKDSLNRFDDEVVTISSMIKTINGKSPSLREGCEYIMGLDAEDYAYLHSYILHVDFGINPIIKTTCKHCGGENSVRITFRSDFFIPTYSFR